MIPILKEDPHYLVVDKRAGLFSQAAPGIDSVQVLLRSLIKERDSHTGTPFVGLPHRLDRGTSGVMLIARNQRALKRFGEQFQSRKVGKYYLAAVEGEVPAGTEKWTDRVRKVQNEPRAELVGDDMPDGRVAELEATRVATAGGLSLLLIKLLTGRMHQIRIQCSHRGFPVVGDVLYGSKNAMDKDANPIELPKDALVAQVADRAALQPNTVDGGGTETSPSSELAEIQTALPRAHDGFVALHALRIEFRHPQTALATSATAKPPETWNCLPGELVRSIEAISARSLELETAIGDLSELCG